MTTDLRDGLLALADRRTAVPPPPDLWRRGVRRRRRARAVAAVGVVAGVSLGVLGTAVGWDALRTPPPSPAGPVAARAIPDRLYTPDPWLEGTEEEPPGQLAVIAGAERRTGWRGEAGNGWIGVSASTGEYRFLDLPGAAELDAVDVLGSEVDAALSPDGRAVAYWLAHPLRPDWVGGWAVYDTVSGDVVRYAVRSRLGLGPETLEWAGPDRLLVDYGVVTEREEGGFGWTGQPTVLWSPETGEATEAAGSEPLPVDSVWPTGRAFATFQGKRLTLREPREGRADLTLRLRATDDVRAGAVNADGTRVALLPHESGPSVRRLLVGQVPPDAEDGGAVATEPLRVGVNLYDLVGWKDAEHVLVRGALPGSAHRFAGIYSVDVRTGARELLVRETRQSWIGSPDYADALWATAPVRRPGPASVPDPRWVAAGGAAMVGAIAWLLVRRRRAAR